MTRAERLKEVLGIKDTPEANKTFKQMLDACCPENFEVFSDQNLRDSECDTCWEMKYGEIKVDKINYGFKYGEEFYYIDELGDIDGTECVENSWSDTKLLESFNMFPKHKKKQLEYLAKKQLLERKLFVYSDRHGAEKIDWNDCSKDKYFIYPAVDNKGMFGLGVVHSGHNISLSDIPFNTEEDAKNAIWKHEDLIKEVLKLQRDLYKGDE